MFAVVMRLAVLVAVLTAIYLALDWYMRRDRRRQLESKYASGDGGALTREDYVTKGLAEYERSWQRKMLLGIFVVPALIALVLALLANWA